MNPRSGIALVMVLWISLLLTFTVYALLLSADVQGSIVENHAAELAARQASLSGIDHATLLLDEDKDVDAIDGPKDSWTGATENLNEIEMGPTGEPTAYYSLIRLLPTGEEIDEPLYGIADEASRINLNVASEEVLMKLNGMTQEIVRAILDWRDADDQPLEMGAESEYYATLIPAYQPRNGPFETLHELLFVKGVTEELFYGEDLNLNGVLDPNEDDSERSVPSDNGDGVLDRGFFHWLTVWSYDLNVNKDGRERIDLNADSLTTLRTELQDVLSNDKINMIVEWRQRTPFASIGQLLQVRNQPTGGRGRSAPVPDPLQITRDELMRIADKVSVNSEKRIPGLINILTAPKEVLAALPGMDASRADVVVNLRDGDTTFRSIAEVLKSNQIPDETFISIAPLITIRSHQFRIDSVGRAPDRPIFRRTWAVYDRAPETPRIVYLKDISSHGFPYELPEPLMGVPENRASAGVAPSSAGGGAKTP